MDKRVKMSRENRAKQFNPFDALKGLQEALRIKEYEHERVSRGDLIEEQISKISNELMNYEKKNTYLVKYYIDGYYYEEKGSMLLEMQKNFIEINDKKISLKDIVDITKLDNNL